jgi:glycerol-3-phosphate dehydrogenase
MPETPALHRNRFLQSLAQQQQWDVVVIGGGATGLGAAVDSASRGFSTLLLEQADFAKGTSSRSTKLVHGGVRYLAQGNIKLVYEALRERGLLLQNAPHLVRKQSFVIPCYSLYSKLKFLLGLKLYDALSGRHSFGKSKALNREQVMAALPHVKTKGLTGGVVYFDGQFDDARLAINLAQTAAEKGGVLLNYCKVTGLLKEDGKVTGVKAMDLEQHKEYTIQAKVIINATGVFVDAITQMDEPGEKPIVRPSQGVHLVFKSHFFESSDALMIPETADGRVLFAVPWHDHVVVGTTDTPLDSNSLEPVALEQEAAFILQTLQAYIKPAPTRNDVKSIFAGLRPLAAPENGSHATKEISRGHKLFVRSSGLITVTGGKWTTYRKMAKDIVDKAIEVGGLPHTKSNTRDLRLHGSTIRDSLPGTVYGADAANIEELIKETPSLGAKLLPDFPHTEAEVVWAVRAEMARMVEDVLARRMRILFLDAKAAIKAAPRVATLMAAALVHDKKWEENQILLFTKLAQNYLLHTNTTGDYERLTELSNLSA